MASTGYTSTRLDSESLWHHNLWILLIGVITSRSATLSSWKVGLGWLAGDSWLLEWVDWHILSLLRTLWRSSCCDKVTASLQVTWIDDLNVVVIVNVNRRGFITVPLLLTILCIDHRTQLRNGWSLRVHLAYVRLSTSLPWRWALRVHLVPQILRKLFALKS